MSLNISPTPINLARHDCKMNNNRKKTERRFSGRAFILILFLGGLGICGFYYFNSPDAVKLQKVKQERAPAIPSLPDKQITPAAPIDNVLIAEQLSEPTSTARTATNELASVAPEVRILAPYARKIVVAGGVDRKRVKLTAEVTPEVENKPVRYSLTVKGELSESDIAEVVKKVRQLGYEPKVIEQKHEVEMTRLLVGTYSPERAREVLADILSMVPEAFILGQGVRASVYAGSYRINSLARDRADYLVAKGIAVEEEKAALQLISRRVIFGDYKDPDEARAVAEKVDSAGLGVIVTRQP